MRAIVPALVLLALTALPGRAAEPRVIDWTMLAPPAAEIENPFENLTGDQLDMLRRILRAELRGDAAGAQAADGEIPALRKRLKDDGLDVDALFAARLDIIAKREAAARAVNDGIVGSDVRMAGFLVPLAHEDGRVVEFLLMPTIGADIHTPPPAPNQIVHVIYPAGIEVPGLFTPVWITGRMTAESSLQKLVYSDGDGAVAVSYRMQADAVEEYAE